MPAKSTKEKLIFLKLGVDFLKLKMFYPKKDIASMFLKFKYIFYFTNNYLIYFFPKLKFLTYHINLNKHSLLHNKSHGNERYNFNIFRCFYYYLIFIMFRGEKFINLFVLLLYYNDEAFWIIYFFNMIYSKYPHLNPKTFLESSRYHHFWNSIWKLKVNKYWRF